MDRLHERKLTLTLEDSQRFSSLIRSGRGRGKHDKNVTWRCFARVDNDHLLLTFLPASYQSLQNFAKAPTELKGERSNSEHTSLPTRESFETGYSDHLDGDTSRGTFGKFWCRRRSDKRSCVDLSVFVFDFALSSLTESGLSNDRDLVNTILLDYRNKLDQFDQVSLLDKSKELRSHCLAIYELFLWCFVSTVFESLRRSEHVDDDNLEEVLAICGDLIPEEIDITEFLGNICSHIKQPAKSASPKSYSSDEDDLFENNGRQHEESAINFLRSNCDSSVTSSQLDGKCEELSGLHDFIQRKFSTLLGKYFAPIPNKRDHYFYSPHFRHISFQVRRWCDIFLSPYRRT